MTLIADIKLAQLNARKARETVKASLLTTLLGELQTLAKNSGKEEPTEAQAIVLVKKFLKNINDTLAMPCSGTKILELKTERGILEEFLPKQLSEEELRTLIADFANQGKDIGDAMKSLKTQFAGQYDGGLASKLMKELL